jgi:subtilase-type serine protease
MLAIVAAAFGSAAQAQTSSYLNSYTLLLPFLDLLNNPGAMASNLQQAISINNNSTAAQRNQSITDNTMSVDNAGIVADGLGTRLNPVYQNAINSNAPPLSATGNITQLFRQADTLAQATAVFDKNYFMDGTIAVTGSRTADLRPFQVAPDQIQNFAPSINSSVIDNPAFPSGHSTIGYTQELLFATMVPERYQQLLTRASEYGDSRIVIGAHYPLDIIGGRIIGTYNVVQLLNNNPDYLNQIITGAGNGTVTTSPDFATSFANATTDLRTLLQQGCGTDLATCAAAGTPDRFSDTQQNRSDYKFRLTYGLPSVGPTDLPPVVPAGAEVLLKTRFPYLNSAQRRDVLATTELPSGVPLDDGTGWARLNLYAATDGYGAFNSSVAVTMNVGQGGYSALDSWNNDISGTGGLTLSGTGTLVLTGADTYSGPTVINGGTLVVNGSIASPVLVNPAGTLRGTGVINASLSNSGTVSPGNSPSTPGGTLSVNGNFTQGPTGTLQTQLDQAGAARLSVNGTATLNGTLRITPLNGFIPGLGQTFSILGASQGVSGTFASLAAPALPGSLFYQPLYTPQAVGIIAAQPLANFAVTPGQRAVAVTLDQIRGNPDPDVQKVLSALYPAEVTGGVSSALDRLAPHNVFSETLFGRLFAGILADQFAGRASALRAGATGFSAAPARFDLGPGNLASLFQTAQAGQLTATDGSPGSIQADSRLGGFISGQFVFGNHNFTPSQTGRPFTAGGVTLGLDYRLDPMSAIGLAGSYFTGDGSVSGGSTNARGALSLYGTTEAGPLYVDGFLGGGFTDYDTTRSLGLGGFSPTMSGSPSGHFVAFGGDTGYRFEQQTDGGLLRWGPVGEVRFNNVAIGGYSETGSASLSSRIRGRDATSAQTGLGAEAALDIPTALGLLTPHLRVSWRHEFADASEAAIANFIVAPGLPFTLTSSRLGRDFAGVTAGISGQLGRGVRLSVDYAGEIGRRNETVHQLSLMARVAF